MWFFISLIVFVIFLIWYKNFINKKFRQIYADAKVLKRKACAAGSFCQSSYISRNDFLDYMGQFLKHKKHEWVFIAFEKDGRVDQFWVNKGPDSEGVSSFLSIQDIAGICQMKRFNHVLVGHNHPSGALAPSRQDRIFLEEFKDAFAQVNVSVEHLVFVAGRWSKYGLSTGQHLRRFLTSQ